jgi:hypothetical protein
MQYGGLECICIAVVTDRCILLGTQKTIKENPMDLGRHGLKKCQEENVTREERIVY